MDIRKALETLRNSISQQSAPSAQNGRSEAVTRPGLLLRRTGLPVPRSHDARSFFGGLPRLPPQLEWPVGGPPDDRCPLMFAAQIDVAEIELPGSPLPRSGTLYFFYYAFREWVEPDEVRVLYYAGAGNHFPERAPPANLPVYFDGTWPWLAEDELIGRIGFKYPIRFVPFTSYRLYSGEPLNNRSALQPRNKEDEALQLKEIDSKLAHAAAEPAVGFSDAIKAAGPTWPFVWGAVQHCARALSYSIDQQFVYSFSLRDKSPEIVAELKRVRKLVEPWLQLAASHELLEPCDEATRQRFIADWTAFGAAIETTGIYDCRTEAHQMNALSLVCNLCASTSPEAVALIPEPLRRAIEAEARWRGPDQPYQYLQPIHQMLGYGKRVQSAPVAHAEDVMLLQIHGDDGIDWLHNIGCVLQVWIAPDALAKRNFDAAKVTFECD